MQRKNRPPEQPCRKPEASNFYAPYTGASSRTRITVINWHIGSVRGQPLPVTELVVEMVQ